MEMMNNKIELPVVVFEKVAPNGGRSFQERSPSADTTAKEAVIKPMFLDTGYIGSMGIRKWDNKHAGKTEKWTVLFDKLKDGESIIIAIEMSEVVALFDKLGIIKVVS